MEQKVGKYRMGPPVRIKIWHTIKNVYFSACPIFTLGTYFMTDSHVVTSNNYRIRRIEKKGGGNCKVVMAGSLDYQHNEGYRTQNRREDKTFSKFTSSSRIEDKEVTLNRF
jgi:hypothetical protein